MKKDILTRFIDRTLSKPLRKQMLLFFGIVGGFIVFFLLCKFIIVFFRDDEIYLSDTVTNTIMHFLNPANFFDDSYKCGDKFVALVIGFFGMFLLSGLLIPLINNMINNRMRKLQRGEVSYIFNNHFVIIGFDGMTASIIKQICKVRDGENGKYIVVQTAKNVEDVRGELRIDLDEKEMAHVLLIHGASNSKEDLEKLYISDAYRVIILGDDDNEAHDVINMQCWWQIASLLEKSENRQLECDVLFNNQSTYVLFQRIGVEEKKNNEQ